MNNASREISTLTTLRFFAAFHVVLLHNFYLSGQNAPAFIKNIIASGHTSVTLFFILSGFILTYVYGIDESKTINRLSFWRKRFARVYPLFFLGILLDAPRVYEYFVSSSGLSGGLLKMSVAFVCNILMIQAWIPRIASTWNTPGWSLSAEAFFYLLFPWAMVKLRQIARDQWVKFLFLLFSTSCILYAPFAIMFWGTTEQTGSWRQIAMYLPALHLPEFLIGVVLGLWFFKNSNKSLFGEFILKWGAVAGTLGILVTSQLEPLIPSMILHIPFIPLHAMLIVSLASPKSVGTSWMQHRWAVFLGSASYAIYILHQPLKNYIYHLDRSWGTFSIYLCLVFGVSALAYQWIEEPLRQRISQARRAPRD